MDIFTWRLTWHPKKYIFLPKEGVVPPSIKLLDNSTRIAPTKKFLYLSSCFKKLKIKILKLWLANKTSMSTLKLMVPHLKIGQLQCQNELKSNIQTLFWLHFLTYSRLDIIIPVAIHIQMAKNFPKNFFSHKCYTWNIVAS